MSDIYLAGQDVPGLQPHVSIARFAAMERARICLGWFGTSPPNEHRFWADLLLAKQMGVRTFLADAGSECLSAGFIRLADGYLHDCAAVELAVEAAQAIVAHDPKSQHTGSRNTSELVALLRCCESPIEQRLALHLFPEVLDDTVFDLSAQVSVLDDRYRLDFELSNQQSIDWKIIDGPAVRIAVEADGHEFHERTKQQAARDKARDRALAAGGWTVLRFTGTEIWADPLRCAREVTAIANQKENSKEAL